MFTLTIQGLVIGRRFLIISRGSARSTQTAFLKCSPLEEPQIRDLELKIPSTLRGSDGTAEKGYSKKDPPFHPDRWKPLRPHGHHPPCWKVLHQVTCGPGQRGKYPKEPFPIGRDPEGNDRYTRELFPAQIRLVFPQGGGKRGSQERRKGAAQECPASHALASKESRPAS